MIEYAAYTVLAFTTLQWIVAFVNWLFRERLPKRNSCTGGKKVSVLIPARDEANNIANLLTDLMKADDGRVEEILVFDDQSTDATAEIVADCSRKESRVRLIRSEGLTPGWFGKNNACHRLAMEATGDYLLFLDADVRVEAGMIDRLAHYAERCGAGLVSIFPTQEMHSWAERITVPNMLMILLSLLALPLVRFSGFASMAAANGQCMMFDSRIYRILLPHERYKASRAEDIEIARYLKRRGRRVCCLTGVEEVRCRMYDSLGGAVEGFAKNVTYFFGNSYMLATLYWLITTLGIVPLLLLPDWQLVGWYLLMVGTTRLFVSFTARQSGLMNLLLWLPQQAMLGLFIVKSVVNRMNNQFRWKGRTL